MKTKYEQLLSQLVSTSQQIELLQIGEDLNPNPKRRTIINKLKRDQLKIRKDLDKIEQAKNQKAN